MGIKVETINGKLCVVIPPEYKEPQWVDSMYKNKFLPEDILTINHREVVEKYMSSQVAVIVAGSNFINMIKQNL